MKKLKKAKKFIKSIELTDKENNRWTLLILDDRILAVFCSDIPYAFRLG